MLNPQQPSPMPYQRYLPFTKQIKVDLPDRTWPTKQTTHAPLWCAVDLRDGNQALATPMDGPRKRVMFELLVQLGFKEIEVGFPAASQTDYDFIRQLIDEDLIPADVTIQVLTQAREELIRTTFEALRGAKQVIVHLYNSTSVLQRDVVFKQDQAGIIELALAGARWCKQYEKLVPGTRVRYEYSPESFTGTELVFAAEICNRVAEVFQPTTATPLIINLPATVEMAGPNVYADMIEWMTRHLHNREQLVISLHPHNDRGSAVAAAELGLLAGADRVEGCLFGNGERTGNVDLVTLGLNLYTQGVDPMLDLSDLPHIKATAEYCTQMPVGERTPWVGELVYTAFSGSHQDAIKKGFEALDAAAARAQQPVGSLPWAVPYLPIDPQDVGRSYEAVIRVNSQSGKGGVAYLLKTDHGLDLPRGLQVEFAKTVQTHTDDTGVEIDSKTIWSLFQDAYLPATEENLKWGWYELLGITTMNDMAGHVNLQFSLREDVSVTPGSASGNGPIDAFIRFLAGENLVVDVHDYIEHTLGVGSSASAVTYLDVSVNGRRLWGVGIAEDIMVSSLRALISAVNSSIGRT